MKIILTKYLLACALVPMPAETPQTHLELCYRWELSNHTLTVRASQDKALAKARRQHGNGTPISCN